MNILPRYLTKKILEKEAILAKKWIWNKNQNEAMKNQLTEGKQSQNKPQNLLFIRMFTNVKIVIKNLTEQCEIDEEFDNEY